MKEFIKSIFFFTILIFLGLVSLYGVLVPDNVPVKATGVVQFGVFKTGLALYQGDRPYYYTFSPYNDYFVLSDGSRNNFFSQEEIKEKRFTTNMHRSKIKDIRSVILSYFGLALPQISYYGENKQIDYFSQVRDNKVTITRRFKVEGSNSPQIFGSTLNYYGIDFVYDKSGNLYGYKSEDEIANFAKFYGITFTAKTEDSRTEVLDKTIIIVNPDVAGAMVVKANENQILWVNRNTRMIEIEEQSVPTNGYYTTTINVEVYENPGQAQNNL